MGLRVFTSTAIAGSVLISDTASAPASSAAFATAAMLPAAGVSLTISGFFAAALAAFTHCAALLGSAPRLAPPSFTLGQEILSSKNAKRAPFSRSITVT